MAGDSKTSRSIPVLAAILAWIVPGAGHVYLGRAKRGIIIFVVIGATFWGGMAMGGALTCDYYNARWWFVAEMVTGVHGLAGWRIQDAVYQKITGLPAKTRMNSDIMRRPDLQDQKLAEENLYLRSPVDVVSRAYAGVAGMLNLLCIVDALLLSMMGVQGESVPAKPVQEEPKAA